LSISAIGLGNYKNACAENQRKAMDTGGKDGTIKYVSRRQSQGWAIQKASEEASHDFLWRYHQRTPQRGMMITIFNRSHYERIDLCA